MKNVTKIRNDFPLLTQKVYGKPLVYFDNAATTQKPRIVIDAINKLHSEDNSNVHRGVHYLSEQMTKMHELARKKVQDYLNARHSHEVIFTSGATGSINAVAYSFGKKYVKEGDEIIVSEMEHHSNIVPWQILCEEKGAELKVIPINDKGELLLDEYKKLINSRTKLVAVAHASNSLGTINPVKEIVAIAHETDIPVLIDGAQAVQHGPVDVQNIDCDFYAFSGHKIHGPTGIGVLYGKERWLKEMPPYQSGGDMIDRVTFKNTTYNILPFKFEAGTPNFIGAIGLGVALDYVLGIGLSNIQNYERKLLDYGTAKLTSLNGLKLYGTAENKTCIFSFLLNDIHPYDVGTLLDEMGIAVRTGHHCTQPLWEHYKIEGSVRASLAFYNTFEEIDYLCEALEKIQKEIIGESKTVNDQLSNKYVHLIELGKNLPSIDPKYKTKEYLIEGCQVDTWFHSTLRDGEVFYDIDSESIVIKGIIALLMKALSGQKPEDIKNADLNFIDKMGLREDFSPTRENSLWKLLNKIKKGVV